MEKIRSIIDKNNPNPYYRQISEWIREKVVTREWEINHQLPSEEDLSKELGVSRGTIRRAISDLIKEGILIQIQGKGTFVAEKKVSYPFGQELVSFAESMERNGLNFTTKVLEMKTITANELMQEKFSIKENNKVLFLKRLRYIDGEPVILIENYINLKICPGIDQVNFEKSTLFDSIESLSQQKIGFGKRQFNAIGLDEEKAELLSLTINTPVLFLDQITYLDDMMPVEFSNIWLKSDKYAITSYLHRN